MNWKSPTSFLPLVFTAACSTITGGGGTTVPLQSTGSLPAARGQIEHKITDNRNVELDINVKHLAEPSRVESGATTYVVWVEPMAGEQMPAPQGQQGMEQGQQQTQNPPGMPQAGRPGMNAQNLGALRVNENLEGKLETVVPYRQFRVYITAEPSPSTTQPSGPTVLSATVVAPFSAG
jgi:hypothetical protein